MSDYHINVFWSDEDQAWVADIPDLAHCSAFGDTPQEALHEVLQAKEAPRSVAVTSRKVKGREVPTSGRVGTLPAIHGPFPAT